MVKECNMRTILFVDPNMSERGTSSATFDYALHNETILGNRSVVATYENCSGLTLPRFRSHFDVRVATGPEGLQRIVEETGADSMYVLKYGFNDGVLVPNARNLVHVVFPSHDPHGDVYAYVSEAIARDYGMGSPFVPHMISLPDVEGDLRSELGLGDRFIFGWYGGFNFEIPFAQEAVAECARSRPDVAFLFMNMPQFCHEPNVLFLPKTLDAERRVRFIRTCDAMVHANSRGETFGISVGESSVMNRPVVVYGLRGGEWPQPGRSHLMELGDKALVYNDKRELLDILMGLGRSDIEGRDWRCYTQHTPKNVMEKFSQVFLGDK